jgi:hypothetical protein
VKRACPRLDRGKQSHPSREAPWSHEAPLTLSEAQGRHREAPRSRKAPLTLSEAQGRHCEAPRNRKAPLTLSEAQGRHCEEQRVADPSDAAISLFAATCAFKHYKELK